MSLQVRSGEAAALAGLAGAGRSEPVPAVALLGALPNGLTVEGLNTVWQNVTHGLLLFFFFLLLAAVVVVIQQRPQASAPSVCRHSTTDPRRPLGPHRYGRGRSPRTGSGQQVADSENHERTDTIAAAHKHCLDRPVAQLPEVTPHPGTHPEGA
ncbi:hypothetical protein OG905_08840 [Streptomyces sp. NBC_00322]|uniref:hypothetical protein n=1 Tax=Streptomyces sp. NBC_00322 TaxID=2975712 RepID=UPI002E29538B|nr:hypothetical protein [Streptomyces sp. NBC_00322]